MILTFCGTSPNFEDNLPEGPWVQQQTLCILLERRQVDFKMAEIKCMCLDNIFISKLCFLLEKVGLTIPCTIGDVANSKRPLLIIPKVQLRLRVTRRSATALAPYSQKLAKIVCGEKFCKNFGDCTDAVVFIQ